MQELSYLQAHFNFFLEKKILPYLQEAFPKEIAGVVCYALETRGKRIRPALCLMAAEFPQKIEPALLEKEWLTGHSKGPSLPLEKRRHLASLYAALALECIHTYSLVHDDLPAMDNDDLRRGRPTAHKAYSEWEAILAGDALNTYAFACLYQISPLLGSDAAMELSGVLAKASGMGGMVGGQALDLSYEKKAPSAKAELTKIREQKTASTKSPTASLSLQSERDQTAQKLKILKKIHSMKTAALLAASCEMGAILRGGSTEKRLLYKKYGNKLGLLFQITDDLLDVTGNAEKMGKAVGKDATLGKWTYPGLLGLQACQREAERLVEKLKKLAESLDSPYLHFWRTLPTFILKRSN